MGRGLMAEGFEPVLDVRRNDGKAVSLDQPKSGELAEALGEHALAHAVDPPAQVGKPIARR